MADRNVGIRGRHLRRPDRKRRGARTCGRSSRISGFWPKQGGEEPFADHINNIAKYVASTTLTDAEWNNTTVIRGDLAAELGRLKAQPGKNISMNGSATLVRWLLRNDLLDELRLLVHPIVVGRGRPRAAAEADLLCHVPDRRARPDLRTRLRPADADAAGDLPRELAPRVPGVGTGSPAPARTRRRRRSQIALMLGRRWPDHRGDRPGRSWCRRRRRRSASSPPGV